MEGRKAVGGVEGIGGVNWRNEKRGQVERVRSVVRLVDMLYDRSRLVDLLTDYCFRMGFIWGGRDCFPTESMLCGTAGCATKQTLGKCLLLL